MDIFVTCTFDLKNASPTDYQNAYAELKQIGLERVVVSDNGNRIVAPTTMTLGSFTGENVAQVRDAICQRVQSAFVAKGLSSEIFVTSCGDWAWGARTTSR